MLTCRMALGAVLVVGAFAPSQATRTERADLRAELARLYAEQRYEDVLRAVEPALWAFAVSLVLLVGPVRALWATPEAGWILPFVLWLLIIGLGAWAVHRASTPP